MALLNLHIFMLKRVLAQGFIFDLSDILVLKMVFTI